MVTLTSLWLPILLSAVAVFFVSFLTHMVLPYHRTDFARLPNEDDAMAALGRQSIPPGDYMFPHHGGAGDPMKDPAYAEKRSRGPAGILTILPVRMTGLGSYLGQWFAFCVVVSLFAAYLSSRALPLGADSAEVFRFAGTVAFMGYGLSDVGNSIWFHKSWSTTGKNLFDALLFGCATAAVFVFMWPR